MTASVYAGKAELTTYYPAPYGEYSTLNATNSLIVPKKTTAERDAITTSSTPPLTQGMVIFNTSKNQLETYVDSSVGWRASAAPEDWTAATLTGSWPNAQKLSTSYGVSYFRDGSGIVHLKGTLNIPSDSVGFGYQIFQLPVGYRPMKNAGGMFYLPVGGMRCLSPCTFEYAVIYINGGTGWVYTADTPTIPLSGSKMAFIILDGVSFRGDQ